MFGAAVAVLILGSTMGSPVQAQFQPRPSGYRTPPFSPYPAGGQPGDQLLRARPTGN
jgi:hypothetical protein